ncbi:MAG TPA: TetR/AcrR family transcriptional regulator [Acidimicrobiales bacterium]
MAAAGEAKRLTRRGSERRRQLLDFATERFAAEGYHATSVAEVVHGVGVGKGVFYWYFESKEALFEEILRETQADFRRALLEAIGSEEDVVRRIELGLRASIRWLDAHRNLLDLFQFAATESRFAPTLHQSQERLFHELDRHIADGVDQGRLRQADPALLTQAILGVLTQLTRSFLRDDGPPADEVADAAVSFCLGGLLPR